jgi:hypothetical protein
VLAVNSQSARTPWRITTAAAPVWRLRLANSLGQAVPTPVPNRSVADGTCSHLTTRSSTGIAACSG